VAVAVDSSGRFYFENGIVTETALNSALKSAAENSREPLTLVIHADKAVTYEQLVRVTMLARDAGIRDVLLATLPRVISTPAQP
jgi:biopolymer transport protein ExbD